MGGMRHPRVLLSDHLFTVSVHLLGRVVLLATHTLRCWFPILLFYRLCQIKLLISVVVVVVVVAVLVVVVVVIVVVVVVVVIVVIVVVVVVVGSV